MPAISAPFDPNFLSAKTAAGVPVNVIANADGSLGTSPITPLNVGTAAYAASLIVKATGGILFSVTGYNSKASAQFIQIHDSATLPADTAVPKLVITVPASSNFTLDFGDRGMAFTNGIVLCNSSTGPTKTIGSADCFAVARYL